MSSMANNDLLLFLFGVTAGVSIFTLLKTVRDVASVANAANSVPLTQLPTQSDSLRRALEIELSVPRETLLRVTRQLVIEMKRGLAADGQTLKVATERLTRVFQMIPSFVTSRPTGKEEGSFLALDLGGSNFRVCEIVLTPNGTHQVRSRQKKFVVSEILKVGNAKDLFDFFAESVESFLTEILGLNDEQLRSAMNLGFTFSFPVQQAALNKGFSASGVENEDVVGLLQDAFKRRNLNIKVTALVNDTVGTLISHAYTDPQTYAGVILGTGTNAAYVERIENIPKWRGEKVDSGEMIINAEWGAFDQEHTVVPFTKYDKILDRGSLNPGKQTYEKMISGLYLGELVRIAVIDLVKAGYLFKDISLAANLFSEPYKFETAYMSRAERDHSFDLSDVQALLSDTFSIVTSTIEERILLKRVCELFGLRAARLSAAGIAAIVTKMNRLDGCTIAIDGSVFEHYPHFANRMKDALRDLLGISAENIDFAQARDGSGQGAALIAALAAHK